MRKHKRSGHGFSASQPKAAITHQVANSPAEQAEKEKQAIALIKQEKLQEAESIYRELIAAGTKNHIVYGNLAAICGMQGELDELIALLRKALQLNPTYPDAHNNLGIALQKKGELTAAIASYNTAIKLKPNYPDAHNNLGNILQEQGDLTAAIASYTTALQLNPNHPDAYYNLGNALKGQGDLTAAIASYNAALQLNPNYPDVYYNLGDALQEQGDLTSAIGSYNTALQLNPNYLDAYNNLGLALQEQGDLSAAIASFNRALQLNPNKPEIHWNYSLTMLLGGDYKNGWEKYEWRTTKDKDPSMPHAMPQCSYWNGEPALDKTSQLLLVTEQGLGDTLHFMRYANALRKQGALVSICAQPILHTLIQASGIDQSPLTPQQANQVSEGQWIQLLSVPKYLQVSPDNPVISEPYIKTTDELLSKWSSTLEAEQRPIIGINWQGNPKTEKTGLRGRSIALEVFAPITGGRQVSLLSLQKGFGSEQLKSCSFKESFVNCQDQINDTWDFLETAAIIANCDLVITSDTSVAHLAGGMGKATWLLLHKVPDWRWGLAGETTFWYPSMRLFRQTESGNWNEVMERVVEELLKHFGSNPEATQPAKAPKQASKAEPTQTILAPISLGELIDKITILQIKTQHLQGTALANVTKELDALETTFKSLQLNIDTGLIQHLKAINEELWQIEDAIRDQEHQMSFGETFIRLARSVYQQNDQRSAIKKEINTTYGSAFVEEKSYQEH